MSPHDEGAPKGAPGGLAAKPDTRGESYTEDAVVRAVTIAAVVRIPLPIVADDDYPGFFNRAASGKTRPAPREDGSHYGCSCCRWTA